MAWKSFNKSLDGSDAEPLTPRSTKAKQVIIQARRDNTHVLYIGGSDVSPTNGLELNFPVDAGDILDRVPLKGDYGNGLDLTTIYVIGTTGEGVQGVYEEY